MNNLEHNNQHIEQQALSAVTTIESVIKLLEPEVRSRVHELMSRGAGFTKPTFKSTPEYVRNNLERMGRVYKGSIGNAEFLGIIKDGMLTLEDGTKRGFEDWDTIAKRILASEELQELIANLETDDSCLPFITADFSQAPLKQVVDAVKEKEYSKLEGDEVASKRLTPFDPNGLNAKPINGKLGAIFIDNGREVPRQTLGMSPYNFAEFCRSNGYHMTDMQNRVMMRERREDKTIGMLSNSNESWLAYSHSSPTTYLRFGLLGRDNGQSHVGGRRQVKVD